MGGGEKSKYRMKQVILWNAAKIFFCFSFCSKFRRFYNIADVVLYRHVSGSKN
jgi:hypothetical protein